MGDAPSEAAKPEGSGGAVKRRRRWPWVTAFVMVGLLVALRAALPTIVERGAAYGSRYWLGLPARIDNADFSLLDGRIVLEGVRIGATPDGIEPGDAALDPPAIDAATALLHLDHIALHLSWQELTRGSVHLAELTIEGPSVRVLREEDGNIDPLRHARPLAPVVAEEPAAAEEAPSEPWPVVIDTFALRTPNVLVVDPPSGENLLEFSLESFSLDHITAKGGDFALGGVGIEGPVLRVRRDLVLARPAAPGSSANTKPVVVVAAASSGEASAPANTAGSPASPDDPPSVVAMPASPEIPPSDAAVPPPSEVPPPAAADPSATAAAAAPAASAPPPAAAPGYRIEKIDIARATFTWVTDAGPLDVAIGLHASGITADQGERFPLDLQLDIAKGHVGLVGEVGILPPSYKGKFSWSGLPFPPLLLASLPELAAWLRSADSTGELMVEADVAGQSGPPSLRLSGRTTVETLAIADPGQKEFALGFRQLEVVMREVVVPLPEEGKPARTTVADLEVVRLLEPKIRYTHPSPALNAILGIPAPSTAAATAQTAPGTGADKGRPQAAKIEAAIPKVAAAEREGKTSAGPTSKGSAETTATSAAPPPPVDVSIGLLELSAGDLEVIDTTVQPAATSFVHELFATAKKVHFPDPSAESISVRAILPKASALTVEGHLEAGNVGEFNLTLQKLDLPVFNSYALAAGASLEAGQASLKTKVKLKGATIQVDNDLVLRKLGVSMRDPSSFERSFGMPIDLALALLRDPSGNISLKIPVRVDEKGTSVSMGAIIASALKQALLGAVTAPLKMLGAVFGGGGDEEGAGFAIAPIGSVAGSAELASDASARIDGLSRLLADRPTMGLLLRGRTGPQDVPPVAEQMLVERVAAGDGLPDLDDAGFLARRRVSQAFERKGKGAPTKLDGEDQALYDRYVASVEVPATRLDALAKQRAEKAKALLLGKGVAASRVTVGDRESEGEAAVVLSFRGL